MTMDAVERGQALRALRDKAGLTQPQVGAEFGISKQAVGEWESGKSRPDVMKLRKLDSLYAAGGKVLELFDLEHDELSSLRAVVDAQTQVLRVLIRDARERLGDESEIGERLADLEAALTQRRPV